MKVIIFEGTSEEFKAVAPYIEGREPASQISLSIEGEGQADNEQQSKEMCKNAIRTALNRLALTDNTKKLFTILAEGEIKYDFLVERMGVGKRGMNGIAGSLGRRIAGTPEILKAGIPGNILAMIDYRLEQGIYYLSLTPNAYEVLKEEGYI